MKRILSLISFLIAFTLSIHAQTLNYYVETTGSDTNDGLTVGNALATVSAAITEIHADFAGGTNNDYTINLGEGIFGAADIIIDNNSSAFTLNLVGAGADKTTLTAQSSDVVTVPNMYLFKQFNDDNSNVNINLNKLRVSNYGFLTNNYGAIFYNAANALDVNFSIDQCIVENITSNLGGIYYTNQATTSFTLTNTYLTDVLTLNHNNRFHSTIYVGAGKAEINNCVFNNFTQDHNSSTQQIKTKWGTILSGVQGKTTTDATELIFVNNTIVNDKAINMEKTWYDKSSVWFTNATENGTSPKLTIANNLFITDMKEFTGTVGTAEGSSEATKYYRALSITQSVADGTAAINWLASSNNVMMAQLGFPETGNMIDEMLTYTSTEIDFEMDGDLPKVLSAENGVSYVKASGTAIVEAGLASVAPTSDITGKTRGSSPWIGAYDAGLSSGFSSAMATEIKLYPNPAKDVVYVKEEIAKLVIYDLTGQLVASYPAENMKVNVSELSTGMYIVNGINTNGVRIHTSQLIKE
ncbi:T9SS type A sorting domain-containing protein [Saccharicrinis sp. GN24d3]|uniref:T9SS type A sorting domain-containing protein n=1 Tax=Saccharicrinis sp. GN24d3 TaxID=3458416 RepID=UPI00403548ED